jgi:hypothetical protein
MAERQKQLAAVRAELEQERAKLEARLTELDARRADVERLRDEAIAAGANVAPIEPSMATAPFAPVRGAANAFASIVAARLAKTEPRVDDKLVSDGAADAELVESNRPAVTPAGRPRWYIPVGAAALLVLLVAIAIALDHRAPPRVTTATARGLPHANCRRVDRSSVGWRTRQRFSSPCGRHDQHRRRRSQRQRTGSGRFRSRAGAASCRRACRRTPR